MNLPVIHSEVVNWDINVLISHKLSYLLIGQVEVEGIGTVKIVVIYITDLFRPEFSSENQNSNYP